MNERGAIPAPPPGLAALAAVAANASTNATITLPAAWIGELLAYVAAMEAVMKEQNHRG